MFEASLDTKYYIERHFLQMLGKNMSSEFINLFSLCLKTTIPSTAIPESKIFCKGCFVPHFTLSLEPTRFHNVYPIFVFFVLIFYVQK